MNEEKTRTPALFRRHPPARSHIPWLPLGTRPTPVDRIDRSKLGLGEGELWVKRDDQTADVVGGNKVRKLEFLLATAKERGADRVVTAGAIGSNHALATTVHARALGLEVSLVLSPQPLTPRVRTILLIDHAYGAELRFTPRWQRVPALLLAAHVAHRADRPMIIPPGGSNAIGTLGYVDAALELAEQIERDELPAPDTVHVAAGTLGTVAGLAIGFSIAGLHTQIHATRVTGTSVTNRRVLKQLVRETARLLHRVGLSVDPLEAMHRVKLRHDQLGAGYGHETPAGRDATERMADVGVTLDPTYTAKAAAGALSDIRAGTGGTHLYWHTLSAWIPEEAIETIDETELPEPFQEYLSTTYDPSAS